MKKIIALLISLTLVMSLFVACGKKDDKGNNDKGNDKVAVKTGLAVVNDIASSKDAGEKDGEAQVNSTTVALTIDADGKIVDCAIDVAQTKIKFSAEGAILSDLNEQIQTKQEKGDAYNMKGNSGIGKEWFEQANAFADYVKGKTVAQVKGIAVDESFHPTDADLAASVTVHINEFVDAIEKAAANAKDLGASASDKLGLAIVTSISGSKDAGEKDGLAQAYSHYSAVTVDAAGKITSCVLDASQGNVNFDASGVVTSDLTQAPETKQEKGDAYNMRGNSGIGKEWNEQADAFAKYVTGKTASEVSGIAVAEGYAANEDLKSSVTVHITDFIAVVAKAVANAK